MPPIPILILAAGASSRMRGRDKLLQAVDNRPLLRRTAETALATGQPVIVALPPAPHPRHAALEGLPLERVEVPDASEGMSASLRAAVARLPNQVPSAMILLGDLPDLTAEDLQRVLDASDFSQKNLVARGATENGKPGHPVVLSARLFPEIAKLQGDGGAQEIIRRHRDAVTLVRLPGQRALRDLDTPEDWEAWLASRE